MAINPARIIFKCATIVGVTNARRDQLADTVRLVADGTLHPRVAAVLPLSEAARAHAMVEADLLPAQGVRAAPLVDANRTGAHAGPRLLDVGSLEPFA